MLQKPVICNEVQQLPFIGTTNGTAALPNELVNVIRSFVPPPPVEITYSIAKTKVPDKSLCLFQRRPTEKNLLQRGDKSTSYSAKDTEMYLEEIFIHLVEPNKYTNGNGDKILHVVLDLMIRWKLDIAVQEQAFKCLVCLSQQCGDLEPPPPTTSSILEAMECFHRFEKIQRMGIKILKCKTFLDRIENKIQVARLIFNCLCNLPEMDDIMLHAKEIVQELNLAERNQLRTCKRYVEMLLDFPNRKNDKITVFLCWCALETLMLLAESDGRWDTFIDIQGQDKLWKMSCRPELEERCQKLLKLIPPLDNNHVLDKRNLIPLIIKPSQPVEVIPHPCIKAKELSTRESTGKLNTDHTLKAGKVKNDHFNQLENRTSSDLLPEGNAIKVLPVDELIRLKSQTPPSTSPDMDDRLFDDDTTPAESASSHFYTMASPSYSPPPETYASLERRFGVPLSPPLDTSGHNDSRTIVTNMREGRVSPRTNEDLSTKPITTNGNKSESHLKLSVKAVQCLFCEETKTKRPLLMKQYNNIAHCILEPRNNMLYKLIQSKLCDLHKMR